VFIPWLIKIHSFIHTSTTNNNQSPTHMLINYHEFMIRSIEMCSICHASPTH